MVLVFDFEDEKPHLEVHRSALDQFATAKFHQLNEPSPRLCNGNSSDLTDVAVAEKRTNPNLSGFSAILCCYPIVVELATSLDLNTLHDLSRTCRVFRTNLLQYRTQLIARSLRCSKENGARGTALADGLREVYSAWRTNGTLSNNGRFTSGKVGKCARDMNCTAKPPPIPAFKGRHRRLCRVCTKSPISLMTLPVMGHEANEFASPPSSPSSSPAQLYGFPLPTHVSSDEDGKRSVAFGSAAFVRNPCSCPDSVWLCHSCGHALRVADTDYSRGWTWRGRYSAYLGGLGTGIGEGIEGVQCGRGRSCLAAKVIEQELDCDAEALQVLQEEADKVASEGTGRSWQGTSFAVQEMEGIGGVVKKKIKRMVNVGAYVAEFEDERDGKIAYLSREITGSVRSWCAWCDRVIASKADSKDLVS